MLSRITLTVAMAMVMVSCSYSPGYVSITGFAQGGDYMVKLGLDGIDGNLRSQPGQIKSGIDSILLAVDNSLSGYNKSSLLSRFNDGETIFPDRIFIDIYNISYGFYKTTGGAFDVAAGPLFDIWGFGFQDGSFPSEEEVLRVKDECGMGRLAPDMSAVLREDGSLSPRDLLLEEYADGNLPRLNYNAIAQGYSCDLVARYLYSIGVHDMLVMVGGEMFCDGVNPSGKPWTIGVDKPVDGNDNPGMLLEGIVSSEGVACGIVTSGNYRKFYIRDGRKYAHTIDPRTGNPASHSLLSATVIASDGTTADALATYCMVIGLDEAKEFINSREDLKGYFIYDTGVGDDDLGTWMSE